MEKTLSTSGDLTIKVALMTPSYLGSFKGIAELDRKIIEGINAGRNQLMTKGDKDGAEKFVKMSKEIEILLRAESAKRIKQLYEEILNR